MEDYILKFLEESIVEVIIGSIHHYRMVMSSHRYIISPLEPNDFLNEDSFSEYS